jgi:hypothetical protein
MRELWRHLGAAVSASNELLPSLSSSGLKVEYEPPVPADEDGS